MAGFSFYVQATLEQAMVRQWTQDQRVLARAIGARIESELAQARQALTALAEAPEFATLPYVDWMDRERGGISDVVDREKRARLTEAARDEPRLSYLFVLTPSGRTYMGHPHARQAAMAGFDVADEPFFGLAVRSQAPAISQAFVGPSGRAAVAVVVPVLNGDRAIVSHVGGILDMAWVQAVLSSDEAGARGQAFLVDGRGFLVAHSAAGLLGGAERARLWRTGFADGGRLGALEFPSPDTGRDNLAVVSRLEGGWRLVFVRERAAFGADVRSEAQVMTALAALLAVILVAAAAMGLFWTGGRGAGPGPRRDETTTPESAREDRGAPAESSPQGGGERPETPYAAALDVVSEGVVMFDGAGRFVLANAPLRQAVGAMAPILKAGLTVAEFQESLLAAGLVTRREEMASAEPGAPANSVVYATARSWKFGLTRHPAPAGGTLFVATRTDERRRMRDRLETLLVAVEEGSAAVLVTDATGMITYANGAFERMTGYSRGEIVGQNPRFLKSGQMPTDVYMELWETVTDGREWRGEFINRRKDGSLFRQRTAVFPICTEDGTIEQFLGVMEEIPARQEPKPAPRPHVAPVESKTQGPVRGTVRGPIRGPDQETSQGPAQGPGQGPSQGTVQEMVQSAPQEASGGGNSRSNLTGLPSRALARDRLAQAIKTARRQGEKVALMVVDLNDFDRVAGPAGSGSAQRLIVEAAVRLRTALRDADTVALAKEDAFLLVAGGLATAPQAETVAQKIANTFADPFHGPGQVSEGTISLNAGVGVALFPDDGDDGDSLIHKGESAAMQARARGPNAVQFFSPALDDEASQRAELGRHLRAALTREEFTLVYQPVYDLRSGAVTGAEALLRWRSARLGDVPPARFLPVAERTTMIVPIGEWVLNKACRQAGRWLARDARPFRISVNLSPRQFRGREIVNTVARALNHGFLPPECLEVEVTEALLTEGPEDFRVILEELRDMGVHVAMDDFGTGKASLADLQSVPLDSLKIDRSFVGKLGRRADDREDRSVIAAAIGMGHALGVTVVAEGVETDEQAAFLRAEGCNLAQGYHFAAPMPAESFEAMRARPVTA